MQLHLQQHQRMNLDETLPVNVLKSLASPSDEAVLQIHSITSITILLQAIKSGKWTGLLI